MDARTVGWLLALGITLNGGLMLDGMLKGGLIGWVRVVSHGFALAVCAAAAWRFWRTLKKIKQGDGA